MNDIVKNEELKPCPFCDSNNIAMYNLDIVPECSIECKDCHATIESSVGWRENDTIKSHDKRCWEKLTKKWNRRVEK